jgi:hypothetical protein
MKILILGGYGSFGGRLAHLLADDARITLLIAGRSLQNAARFCDGLSGNAARVPLYFERNGDIEQQLRDIMPDLLVDASGPFQQYGADPYRVVKACLACDIDYMDLADGADFVKGFPQFDQEARERGRFALTGVSSFPVLSAAVVRRLAHDMARVADVAAGVAPSPFAKVGVNVVAAIANYAGKPSAVLRDGKMVDAYPFTETMRYTIAPAGRLPLRNLRFAMVEVPDQHVLPQSWPGLRSIWVGAAVSPQIYTYMFGALAWLVRWRLLPSLSPFALFMQRVAQAWRWGEHRGGMFVEVRGIDALGHPMRLSWHLLAEENAGPHIPAMPVAALVYRYLNGQRPQHGARAAQAELELEDFNALFGRFRIATDERVDTPLVEDKNAPLYAQILGKAWEALPEPIRRLHANLGSMRVSGRANVDRGKGIVARIIAALIGFPEEGSDIPVSVQFDVHDGVERWQRTFGSKSFVSTQRRGRGRSDRLVEERFGPLRFGLALVRDDIDGGRLHLVMRRWSLFGLPLPSFLRPTGNTYEHVEEGKFCFHVEIAHPLFGLIVRYRGWLV